MKYYKYFKGLEEKKTYSEKTSLSLAVACNLAYEKKKAKISGTIQGRGYKLIGCESIVKKPDIDTQYFVMSNDDNIVVVFRGSDDLKDWFSNFQAVYDPGPLKETKVHEGFQDALFPAVISLTNLIDSAAPENKKIWVTGPLKSGSTAGWPDLISGW